MKKEEAKIPLENMNLKQLKAELIKAVLEQDKASLRYFDAVQIDLEQEVVISKLQKIVDKLEAQLYKAKNKLGKVCPTFGRKLKTPEFEYRFREAISYTYMVNKEISKKVNNT